MRLYFRLRLHPAVLAVVLALMLSLVLALVLALVLPSLLAAVQGSERLPTSHGCR